MIGLERPSDRPCEVSAKRVAQWIGKLVVMEDSRSTLFDRTSSGGIAGSKCPSGGCGTVFELQPYKWRVVRR